VIVRFAVEMRCGKPETGVGGTHLQGVFVEDQPLPVAMR